MQKAQRKPGVLPTAVLFDWDNTLVNTWPLIHGGISVVFEKRGLMPWTLDDVKARCHESAREAFPKLFPDDWQAAMDDYYGYITEHHLKDLVLLPYAAELLATLAGHGVHMGIVSNKNKALLAKEVCHLGLSNYFASIIGSTDALYDKPHPDPIYMALQQLNVEATPAVWFVGDSPVDWKAAKAAGVHDVHFGEECFKEYPTKTIIIDDDILMVRDLRALCDALFE